MVILVEELRSRASLASSLCVCGDCVCIYPSNLIPLSRLGAAPFWERGGRCACVRARVQPGSQREPGIFAALLLVGGKKGGRRPSRESGETPDAAQGLFVQVLPPARASEAISRQLGK